MNNRTLIIDDSFYMRARIKDALQEVGYEIVGEAESGEKAIDLVFSLKPDLITLDNILPDMVGIEVLRVLMNQEHMQSRIVMIGTVGQEKMIGEGLRIGASGYIVKPFTNESLVEKVDMIMQREIHGE